MTLFLKFELEVARGYFFERMFVVLLRLRTKNNISFIVLGLFILPFKDRFPDTKIATYSQSLSRLVFCVVSCLPLFLSLLFLPINCYMIHVHVDQFHSFFPQFNSVSEELYPYYKCIHCTVWEDWLKYDDKCEEKQINSFIITCLLYFLSSTGSFRGAWQNKLQSPGCFPLQFCHSEW